MSAAGLASPPAHAFRDCRSDDGAPVLLVASDDDAPVVTLDNCQNLTLAGATGLARVVGGYDPTTDLDKRDVAPARLGLDQDAGGIPWTAPASAPLQFTSVKAFVPIPDPPPPNPDLLQTQVLMRVSERDEVPGGQVTRWSLSAAGETRELVQIAKANGDPAFEFDTVTERSITVAKNNAVNTGDPTTDNVIKNMRTRIQELETILRAVVKTILPPP